MYTGVVGEHNILEYILRSRAELARPLIAIDGDCRRKIGVCPAPRELVSFSHRYEETEAGGIASSQRFLRQENAGVGRHATPARKL